MKKQRAFSFAISCMSGWVGNIEDQYPKDAANLRAAIRVLKAAEGVIIHLPDKFSKREYFYEGEKPNRRLAREILAARKAFEKEKK
jgi:hypothetical protein